MGVLAGYGDPKVKLIREGSMYNFAPGAVEAIPFEIDVEDPDYDERWADELEVITRTLLFHWTRSCSRPSRTSTSERVNSCGMDPGVESSSR